MDPKLFERPTDPHVAQPVGDRRATLRARAVCKVARVQTSEDQGLARIRNISDGGMRLALRLAAQPGDLIDVALTESLVVAGRVVWNQNGDCGLEFLEFIDSASVLRLSAEEARDGKIRAPRLYTAQPIVISSERGLRLTYLHDISQRGMKIADQGIFTPGLAVTAMIGPKMERSGYVRWVQNGFAGLILTDPLSVEELGSVRAL